MVFVNSQSKLQNLAGQRSDVLENLTPAVKKRVDALRDIQVRKFPKLCLLYIAQWSFVLCYFAYSNVKFQSKVLRFD